MSQGRIVWRELLTTDTAAARGFYTELFGWSFAEMQMGMPHPYVMFHHDGIDEDVGGMMAVPMPGVPSHWLDYLTVLDVDAALVQVVALGGKKITDVMAIPGVGRFAIVQDPTDAVFGILQSNNPGATDTERKPPMGTFCWSQLMTADASKVIPFYSALFGWTAAPMGPNMTAMNDGEVTRCTLMEGPTPVNHWLKYVAVDDADAAFAQAVSLGAQAFHQPTTMEGMGRFAVLADPTGSFFALWKDLSPAS